VTRPRFAFLLPTLFALGALATPAAAQAPKIGVDDVLLEVGALADAPEAGQQGMLRATPTVQWRPNRSWEARAGILLTAVRQQGGTSSYTGQDAELADTYLRYRAGDARFTAGLQTILWGRVDEVPAADRVSRVDATRLLLDNLAQRRRAMPALRWEQNFDTLALDVVVLPSFEGAALADTRSIWSPVDQRRGLILGIDPPAALSAFIRAADVKADNGGSGGSAFRLTQTGAGTVDWGLTMARTRQSLPYYAADPTAGTLTATHPYTRFLGGDLEFNAAGATWRSELGLTWDSPATTPAGQPLRTRAVDWIGAVEFFPGGENTRVNLQLAARELGTRADILELRRYAALGGEVETTVDRGRWKLALRFNSGLNVHDTYLAPKVTFTGWEPHDLYVVYHHFDGERRTLGGFHRDHGLLAVGLRTRF
jgi:hypothetical protein